MTDEYGEVFGMEERDIAIEALEQEPCGDAISREDALQALCKAVHKNDDTIPCLNQRVSCLWDKTKVQDYAEEILKLPPVTPAEKVGQNFEGMTNGEVIKALFPQSTRVITTDKFIYVENFDTFLPYAEFYKDWWNAPYKGGEQNESN